LYALCGASVGWIGHALDELVKDNGFLVFSFSL